MVGWLAGCMVSSDSHSFSYLVSTTRLTPSPLLRHNGFPISRFECGLNFPWKAVSALLPSQHGCKLGLIFDSGENFSEKFHGGYFH